MADHLQSIAFHAAKETTLVAFVTGGVADLMNLEENRVGVAVDEDFEDFLNIAAFLALAP